MELSRSFSPEVVRERVLECIVVLFRETPILEEREILGDWVIRGS